MSPGVLLGKRQAGGRSAAFVWSVYQQDGVEGSLGGVEVENRGARRTAVNLDRCPAQHSSLTTSNQRETDCRGDAPSPGKREAGQQQTKDQKIRWIIPNYGLQVGIVV